MASIIRLPRFDPRVVPQVPVELDRSHPLARGLTGFWLLAGDVKDLSGNGFNGSTANAPSVTSGPRGPWLNLVGASTQYVNIPNATGLESPAMSYVAWVNPASFPNGYNTVAHIGNGAFYFGFYVTSAGKLAIYTLMNYDGSGAFTLSAGTTYCLAATYDGASSLNGYVNGALDKSVPAAGNPYVPQGTPLSIGRDSFTAGRNWNGNIGPLGLWSRALTASETAWLYAEPFAMLRPIVRRKFYIASASSGVTVSLTQQAGTGTTGSIAASQALPLAQDAATGAVGTITPTRAAALSQTAATGTVGALAPSAAPALAQVSATGTVGTVTAVIGVTAALSQQAAAGTIGAVTAATSRALAGVSATGTVGTVAPSVAPALTQDAATGTVGTVAPAASVGLTQQAATGNVGTVSASTGSNLTVSLSQQTATGTIGTITASIPVTVSLAQVAAVGTIGAMAPARAAGITQQAATCTVGTVQAVSGVTAALSQVSATGAVGTLAWARSLGLAQMAGIGVTGALTVGGAFFPSHARTIVAGASSRRLTSIHTNRGV